MYAPYKAARGGTLADQAREKGHGPLADSVWGDTATNDALRRAQREPGVLHLLAERVSESVDARASLRDLYWRQSSLTVAEAKKLTEDGTAVGGMIPKLGTAMDAVNGGVGEAVIMDGRVPHCSIEHLFGSQKVGTAVY